MIGLVENAMLARIRAACDAKALPYAYLSYSSWPKDFDAFLSDTTIRYPACWSVFGGIHGVDRMATGLWRAHCAFGLVVAAESKRNEQSRRMGGSASEPGSYQLAVDAFMVLADQRLGIDELSPLRPTSIMPVETPDVPKVKQLSIYAVSFDTDLLLETAPVLPNITDFATFHADWDPAPYGHVDPNNLPDDAHAIGVDHIRLETA